MSEHKQKVFVVGFHKTGTSTLAKALDILGYRVDGPSSAAFRYFVYSDSKALVNHIERYDAFQDDPWFFMYEFLYQEYPDAKFILTNRDVDGWYRSVVDHFGEKLTEARRHLYKGVTAPAGEQLYKSTYRAHIDRVRDFFAEKENFIELDVTQVVTWSVLCDFLGEPVPKNVFGRKAHSLPRVNSKKSRQLHEAHPILNKVRYVVRQCAYRVLGDSLADKLRSMYSSIMYGARRS